MTTTDEEGSEITSDSTPLDAIASYSGTVVSLCKEIAVLWPDVQRLIGKAKKASDHPEARAVYELISERQDATVANTLQALEAAQNAIDAIKAAEYDRWLGRIQDGYQRVDSSVFANEAKLVLAKKAQQIVETTPFTAAGVVAHAHLALYTVPHLHREVLAAYLNRPSTARRVKKGAWAILVAAAGDAVPGSGTVIATLKQTEPQIEQELRALPGHLDHHDRALHLRDALERLCELSQLAQSTAEKSLPRLDELHRGFEASASWLLSELEGTGPSR